MTIYPDGQIARWPGPGPIWQSEGWQWPLTARNQYYGPAQWQACSPSEAGGEKICLQLSDWWCCQTHISLSDTCSWQISAVVRYLQLSDRYNFRYMQLSNRCNCQTPAAVRYLQLSDRCNCKIDATVRFMILSDTYLYQTPAAVKYLKFSDTCNCQRDAILDTCNCQIDATVRFMQMSDLCKCQIYATVR